MQQPKKIPMRMCLSCRNMQPKRDLIRVVKTPDNIVVVDDTSKMSGRGAYLCRSEECLKKCIKSKALSRQFECAVDDVVIEQIRQRINESER